MSATETTTGRPSAGPWATLETAFGQIGIMISAAADNVVIAFDALCVDVIWAKELFWECGPRPAGANYDEWRDYCHCATMLAFDMQLEEMTDRG